MTRFAFSGLSLGGMIGQWLAAHAPERVTQLVLANTTSKLSDPQPMEARRRAVLDAGMGAIEALVMGRFFSASVLDSPSPQVESARRTLLSTSPVGYAGCCAAIRDMDHSSLLAEIHTPTLVISGDLDVGMPWDLHAAILTRDIPGALAVRCRRRTSRTWRSRVPSAPPFSIFSCPRRWGRATPVWACGAPCSAATMSIAPSPGPPTSRAISRCSSPATPGAASGRGRASTTVSPPAGPDSDGRARPLGRVPPSRPHRPGARAGALRSPGGPAAARGLRGCPPPTPRSISPLRSSTKSATDIPAPPPFCGQSLVYISCVS